jgi:sigma-B regulation protein RsbU (phosphoserine phosphatase)
VVAAVAKKQLPVRASNLRFGGGAEQLGLTLTDQDRPRAVLCVPIAQEGDTIDVLYMDVPADKAGQDALDFARALGRQVGFARKSLLLAEETARRRLLDHQLEMAREIQSNMWPARLDLAPGVDLAALCKPAMTVGGDHCDVWSLPDGRIALVVGDVSGKGLPAAMVMTNLQAALRTALEFCSDPAGALTRVNRHLREHTPLGTFVTLFLGLLDPAAARLDYVNAGHVLPLVVGGGKVEDLGPPKHPPLSLNEADYTTDSRVLEPGQAVVIVSDGVTEARSPASEEFGVERLRQMLQDAPATAGEIVSAIGESVRMFRDSCDQQDDITILVLRMT